MRGTETAARAKVPSAEPSEATVRSRHDLAFLAPSGARTIRPRDDVDASRADRLPRSVDQLAAHARRLPKGTGRLLRPSLRPSRLEACAESRDARRAVAVRHGAVGDDDRPTARHRPVASGVLSGDLERVASVRYRARREGHREPDRRWARHSATYGGSQVVLTAVGRDRSRWRAIDQRKQPAHPASRIGRRHLDCLWPFKEGAVARRRADGCAEHRCCVVRQTNTRSPDDKASTWSRWDAGSSFARPSAADAKNDAPDAQPGSRDGVVRVQWICRGGIADLRALLPVGNAGLKRVHPRLEHGNVVVQPVDQTRSSRVADPRRAIQRVVPNGQSFRRSEHPAGEAARWHLGRRQSRRHAARCARAEIAGGTLGLPSGDGCGISTRQAAAPDVVGAGSCWRRAV